MEIVPYRICDKTDGIHYRSLGGNSMKKTVWVAFAVLLIVSMALTACGGGGGSSSGGSSGIKRQNTPADYAAMKNPFEGQADAATAGKEVYTTNCQGCHGESAKGDGPAAASMNPKPADLTKTVKETDAQYMHWVISVGGAAAGLSASMPAFKDVLTDDDIWKVDTYLRTTYGGK
jgi:mono/diheme cytochrome c family protein